MGICGFVVDRGLEVAMGQRDLNIKKVDSTARDLVGEADVGMEIVPCVNEI